VDLIGPYTLKGKDKTEIYCMCITMIGPASSWFKIAELPISQPSELDILTGTKGHKGKDKNIDQRQPYFEKSSATVRTLVNRTWFSRYPLVSTSYTTMEVNLNFTLRPSVIQMV
jgi:hypothetical protein